MVKLWLHCVILDKLLFFYELQDEPWDISCRSVFLALTLEKRVSSPETGAGRYHIHLLGLGCGALEELAL